MKNMMLVKKYYKLVIFITLLVIGLYFLVNSVSISQNNTYREFLQGNINVEEQMVYEIKDMLRCIGIGITYSLIGGFGTIMEMRNI